jgi:haloalkane dehalogenase
MHYIDEGEGDPILFLHGNPTSSYLWRNIIPHVTPFARAIAPDLIGMGRSDKPSLGYRFFDHVRYLEGFIEALGLERITLVIHDWGSALGFHYARRHEVNVRALAFTEAIIRPTRWSDFPAEFKLGFKTFRAPVFGWMAIVAANMFLNKILPETIVRRLTPEEMRRYKEPYSSWSSRKPIRQWPCEIPIDGHPADVHEAVAAYSAWLQKTPLPKLLLHARPGGVIKPGGVAWAEGNFPNLRSVSIGQGIHFVQEDHPDRIGRELADWYLDLSQPGD